MNNHNHKILLITILLFLASCAVQQKDEQSTTHDSSPKIWFRQAKIDLGAKIIMINEDHGYAITRGKGSEVKGKAMIFKGGKWNSFYEYDYSDFPLIEKRADGAVWFVHHGTHHESYKPHLKSFSDNTIKEIPLPIVMWDKTDWAMWLGISSTQSGKAFLVGQRGNIIYYDGKSWKEFPSPVKNNNNASYLMGDLHDLQMLSDTSGWAVGKKGIILKFTNGKWKIVDSKVDRELLSISMIDENNGWIVGEQGTILKYENGKWRQIESGVRVNLNSIVAFDNKHAWICGNRATLLEYDGEKWSQDNSINTIDDIFVDLDIVKDSDGVFRIWIIGDNGIYTNSQNLNFSFSDITSQASLRKEGRAATFLDYDKDDLPEIFVLSEEGPNILYQNQSGNLFSEVKRENAAKENNFKYPLAITGDINNDGYNDFIEILDDINYTVKFGRSGFSFIDKTENSKIVLENISTENSIVSGALVDFNNDGNLDIYLANHNYEDILLKNNGAGQFTNVFKSSGIKKLINHRSYSATFSDLNNDGLVDVLISYKIALDGQNLFMYLNKGNFKFEEKYDANFSSNSSQSTYSVVANDINNDGSPDLIVFNNEKRIQLLLNRGDASFYDIAETAGLSEIQFHPEPTNGIMNVADVNSDGWADIFIGSKLYINSPQMKFREVSEQVGIGFIGSPSFADIDNDGDVDLYIGSSRSALGSGDRAVLYRNNSFYNSYVKVVLKADLSNRSAIGAKILLEAFYKNGKKAYSSLNEFGLGSSAIAQQNLYETHYGINPELNYKLKIIFPSGIIKSIEAVQPNQKYIISESNFLSHHFILLQKSVSRTFLLVDWRLESVKFLFSLLLLSLMIYFGSKTKSKKAISSWYFVLSYILIYLILVHLNVDSGALKSLLFTFVPLVLFGVVFILILSKIIEERESRYISHYKLLEILGVGGMGKVFKAIDTQSNNIAAVKILNPHLLKDEENRKRLAAEGRLLSTLEHPNIVKIYEFGESKEHSFIAMEYLSGGTLQDYIENNYPLKSERIVNIALQICSGLDAIHSNDIIHRDLKSPNIMFDEHNKIRIMDFGLSKSPLVTTMTSLGTVIGTLGYVAPEQVTNIQIDQRVDIFSFGVILYQLVTNRLPFNGENEIALIHSIFNTQPELPSKINLSVPHSLEAIIMKCIEKDQNKRYKDVKAIIAELNKIAE